MQGDQVKALIIVSKAKGWDPNRIWDAKTRSYGDSIENFNQPPLVLENQAGTGRLPQGTPDTFPDAEEPRYKYPPGEDWNVPHVERETADHSTNNSDPFAGMGGM
jgi:hypothetical protein